ncbi:MAG: TfoX/Sxy family protein [Pyrinomonadaceae bacterium]|nr:TfoX/Sxy family protein [Pyrinomonadaceae bacterium]
MGRKGDKMSADAPKEADEVLRILSPLGDVSSRKMFGGFGIFEGGKMFGIIDSAGGLFLKADETNLSIFESAGSEKHGRMPYYSVPPDVRGSNKKLREWAETSIDIVH